MKNLVRGSVALVAIGVSIAAQAADMAVKAAQRPVPTAPADWNLIARTIIPVISQPDPILDSNTNGIGDITEELFFSPRLPHQTGSCAPNGHRAAADRRPL